MKNLRCWPGACLLVCLGSSAAAQIDEGLAARVKATFLCRVPEFTTWPDEKVQPEAPWTVCVLGADPYGVSRALESSIARDELKINGRTVAVAKLAYAPPDAGERGAFEEKLFRCRTLFVTRAEAEHWPEIRRLVAHKPILVFSEIPQFSRSGGMIEFVMSTRPNGSLGIDLHIDLDAVITAGLHLKSTFLSIRNVLVVKAPNREGAIHPLLGRLARAGLFAGSPN